MIYLLFGEMGIGKNYIGEKLAKKLNTHFFDGDLAIPYSMRCRVERFRPISDAMLNDFVSNYLIPKIKVSHDVYDNVVVAQALYKRKHRRQIQEYFRSAWGEDHVMLIHVVAPSLRVHLARIMTRPRGLKWAAYCLLNKPFFQKPSKDVDVLVNDCDANIEAQIDDMLS